MRSRYVGHRVSVHQNGHLYLARDDTCSPGPGPMLQPQHAVIRDDRLVWRTHEQGGMMEPLIEDYDRTAAAESRWYTLERGAQPKASTAA